jgi:hypothetical protein
MIQQLLQFLLKDIIFLCRKSLIVDQLVDSYYERKTRRQETRKEGRRSGREKKIKPSQSKMNVLALSINFAASVKKGATGVPAKFNRI